jgi:hypothetical protein
MEKIIRNLNDLYFIHSKIVTLAEDPTARIISPETLLIYGQSFSHSSYLSPDMEVFVGKSRTPFSLSKTLKLLGNNRPGGAAHSIYLSVLSTTPESNLRSSRKIQKIIGELIADEIEKIKGFFYTKLKHDSNYPDLLGLKKVSEADFKANLDIIFWDNPFTALAYSQRLYSEISNPKQDFMSRVFGPLVEKVAEVFVQYREFLSFYLDYKSDTCPEYSMHTSDIIMYWEMPFIPTILKYIGQKYGRYELLGNFFAKMMLRINSSQLSFYLSQIFQSLDYATAGIIEEFMIKYAQTSPLFAHQVIWMARVEEKAETSEEMKTNQQKRAIAEGLPQKIIKNMGLEEKKFWDEVDSFYEQITKISSVLKPKMPKMEKKEIINKKLEVIKMPPLVYLPTNSDYRVSRIKLGSGNPMQSAAKCPILVSFYCKKFEGPDAYFASLKARRDEPVDRESMLNNDDLDEHVPSMAEKLNNRSLSIKDNIIIRDSGLTFNDKHNIMKVREDGVVKLNHLTEELFPIFASGKLPFQGHSTRLEAVRSIQGATPKRSPYPEKSERSFFPSDSPNNNDKTPMKSSLVGGSTGGFGIAVSNLHVQSGQSPKRHQAILNVSQTPINSFAKPNAIKFNFKEKEQGAEEDETVVSCIFKTFDDIRRDNLSLQIIRMFQEIFAIEKLDLFLFPYKTISTRTGNDKTIGGIIEVVPNTFSRDQIGKENKYSLYEFFKEKYGSELGTLFQEARENFVKSMAAYSVVSYILQIKDRHNGNILIDQMGRLIHIDFGFIFSISPGKNLGFENAQFKLTK